MASTSSPSAPAMAAAPTSNQMTGLLNWPKRSTRGNAAFSRSTTFGPCSVRREVASAVVRPCAGCDPFGPEPASFMSEGPIGTIPSKVPGRVT